MQFLVNTYTLTWTKRDSQSFPGISIFSKFYPELQIRWRSWLYFCYCNFLTLHYHPTWFNKLSRPIARLTYLIILGRDQRLKVFLKEPSLFFNFIQTSRDFGIRRKFMFSHNPWQMLQLRSVPFQLICCILKVYSLIS